MAGGRAQWKEIAGTPGGTKPLNCLYLTGDTSADPAPRGKAHTGNLDGEGESRK